MTIQDMGAVGELIGGIAVIITLIYLAAQIRQNTKAVRSTALETSASRSMEISKLVAGNDELAPIVMAAFTGKDDLDEVERFRLSFVYWIVFRSYEVTIALSKEGYIRASRHEGTINNLSIWTSISYFDDWWESAKLSFSDDLKVAVEDAKSRGRRFPIMGSVDKSKFLREARIDT